MDDEVSEQFIKTAMQDLMPHRMRIGSPTGRSCYLETGELVDAISEPDLAEIDAILIPDLIKEPQADAH